MERRLVFVQLLLWVALIVVGYVQWGKLSAFREELDNDLRGLQGRRHELEQELLFLKSRRKEQCEWERVLKELRKGKKQAEERCDSEKDRLRSEIAMWRSSHQALVTRQKFLRGGPLQQGHGHESKKRSLIPLTSVGFALNKTTEAPPFLEPVMGSGVWNFHRTNASDIGLLNIMPWPTKVIFSRKFVRAINKDQLVKVQWENAGEFGARAVQRFQTRVKSLWRRGGRCGHPEMCDWEESGREMQVFVRKFSVSTNKTEEEYTITIDGKGRMLVKAEGDKGVLRALATVSQLLTLHEGEVYFPIIQIVDKPASEWRGLLLDVARHFHPKEQIISLLDGMEFVRMNVLHWHLSDDQGFRVESKTFPRLHLEASGGEFYTQEDVKLILDEAHARGIRVVPEFDMPAHNGAVILAYPELHASGQGPDKLVTKWGVLPWALDPTREEVYEWIEKFLEEMTGLFPDEYVHLGGDEVPAEAWNEESVKEFMRENKLGSRSELQAMFTRRVMLILAKLGRKMVGWDEIVSPNLSKNVTVQIWRSWVVGIADEVSRLGLDSILSAELYLDWVRPIRHYYKQSPGSKQNRGRIGGEACMWSEWASHNIDNRIWPTLAAISERMWHGDMAFGGTEEMYARMFEVSRMLDAVGVRHAATYDVALETLLSGREFSYVDVLSWIPQSDSAEKMLVRRLINAVQPVSRVDGGSKHSLVQIADAARPDSLEMRALGMLCERCALENFTNVERVSVLRSYLQGYAELDSLLRAKKLFTLPLLAAGESVAADISMLASKTVAFLDVLAAGDGKGGATAKAQILRLAAKLEDAMVEGNKMIIEFAHVLETMLFQNTK